MLALEAYFDVKWLNVPIFGNRPSFQCKFYKTMFKDNNTLPYHMMMNLCPEDTRKELLKMYPTITKFKAKKLTKSGEKHRNTLLNYLKCPHEDGVEHSPKSASPLKNPKKPMGMPLARPIRPKEKKIYELNNDEDCSYIKTAKIGKLAIYFHFLFWQCNVVGQH